MNAYENFSSSILSGVRFAPLFSTSQLVKHVGTSNVGPMAGMALKKRMKNSWVNLV